MGKVNYQHLKRLKENARKNRQQEKLDRRASKQGAPTSDTTSEAPNAEEVTDVRTNALP